MAASVTVSVNDMKVDAVLHSPVYCCSGVLLLAAGLKFTEAFRDKLITRGVHQVVISEVDAAGLSTSPSRVVGDRNRLKSLESALNERIDNFVRQHSQRPQNQGPAVADKVARHGASDYSKAQLQATEAGIEQNESAIESMLEQVANGQNLDATMADRCAESSLNLLIADFACTVDARFRTASQRYLAAHSAKMATLGMAIGIEMGFDFETVRTIGTAGMLADLGMAAVPQHLLQLQRRLTRSEMLAIQKHCIYTADLLEKMGSVPGVVSVVAYQVHEKPDGTGYPRGLTLKSIHPYARVLHAADAYAAMTSDRPDRPRMIGYLAMEALLRQSKEKKQDPEVVRALLKCMGLCPIGSYVVLSDQSIGYVIRTNGEQFTRPIVRRLLDPTGTPVAAETADAVIDLAQSDLTIKQAIPSPKVEESRMDHREAVPQALTT